MSTSLEDWLKEKHAKINAEDRAKLVQEYTKFMKHGGLKDFDKMSPQQALQVFVVLIEEEEHRLTSLRQLIETLADSCEDDVH
jgi:hypothetical protein